MGCSSRAAACGSRCSHRSSHGVSHGQYTIWFQSPSFVLLVMWVPPFVQNHTMHDKPGLRAQCCLNTSITHGRNQPWCQALSHHPSFHHIFVQTSMSQLPACGRMPIECKKMVHCAHRIDYKFPASSAAAVTHCGVEAEVRLQPVTLICLPCITSSLFSSTVVL